MDLADLRKHEPIAARTWADLLQLSLELRLGMVFEVLDAEVVLVKDEDGDERRVLWLTVQVRHREGHTTDLAWPVALPAWLELN